MSGALTTSLAAPGPLHWMADAIAARLREAFPPAYFAFAWMPSKPDRSWFQRTFQRCPAVALAWNGSPSVDANGELWAGKAHFTVALIVKNASGAEARYKGDKLGPGLFAMQRVAIALLHGYLINPDRTPWTATGTIKVTAVGNLYSDEWGDQDAAICGVDLEVEYEEVPPPDLEDQVAADFWALNFDMTTSAGAEAGGATGGA